VHKRVHYGNAETGRDQLAHHFRVVAFKLKLAANGLAIKNLVDTLP
jgi:hypothetical protein